MVSLILMRHPYFQPLTAGLPRCRGYRSKVITAGARNTIDQAGAKKSLTQILGVQLEIAIYSLYQNNSQIRASRTMSGVSQMCSTLIMFSGAPHRHHGVLVMAAPTHIPVAG